MVRDTLAAQRLRVVAVLAALIVTSGIAVPVGASASTAPTPSASASAEPDPSVSAEPAPSTSDEPAPSASLPPEPNEQPSPAPSSSVPAPTESSSSPAPEDGEDAPREEADTFEELSAPQQRMSTMAAASFNAGNIISNEVFFHKNSMTEGQVQQFLNEQRPSCAGTNGQACLKSYTQSTYWRPADKYCGSYTSGANETAARIIWKVAQACGVNPQVLLVTLQKEQGLITQTSPTATQYRIAMGYACPDTAACDSKYFGFFNQVFSAARQFKVYELATTSSGGPYFTRYAPGGNRPVQYHPSASCGSSQVYIENQATANLYYYTPYQPNAASLAAGTGASSDRCAAYGNRNFHNYFTSWFGSTQELSGVPFGWVNEYTSVPGGVYVKGWAIDPDTVAPVKLHLTVNNVWRKSVLADQWRSDVGASNPAYGGNHGFYQTLPLSGSTQKVCVIVENQGWGPDRTLGCKWIAPLSGDPFGWVNAIDPVSGGVDVQGWAIDPDTTGVVKVHITSGGAWKRTVFADQWRVDIGAANPQYGSSHAFRGVRVPLSPGVQRVCLVAENIGWGNNRTLACRWMDIPA